MSEIWKCQGVQRQGFDGVWRGGRMWPSAAPVEIEVLDEDACPTVMVEDKDAPGGKRQALDPVRIGRKNWATVLADGRVSKTRVVGGEGEEEAASKALREELRKKLALAEEATLEAKRECAEAQEQLTNTIDELAAARTEIGLQRERIMWLEAPEGVPVATPFGKTEPVPEPKRGSRK